MGAENRPPAAFRSEPSSSSDAPLVVDPLALSLATPGAAAQLGEPAAPMSFGSAAPAAPTNLDAVLAAEVLHRVAWGGDRRRGVARLELGGELAGAVVVVRGEGREVSLELTLPEGRGAAELPERLLARLTARGLIVRELVVR